MTAHTSPRRYTPARIVALAAIAAVAAALGLVHFASGSDEVSVPPGARAGQLTMAPDPDRAIEFPLSVQRLIR